MVIPPADGGPHYTGTNPIPNFRDARRMMIAKKIHLDYNQYNNDIERIIRECDACYKADVASALTFKKKGNACGFI
jgi:hypothetical protein